MFEQVKASAGSGKTYALTARFLNLILDSGDERPDMVCASAVDRRHSWPEVMAVTFTNRAAAEMKERVVDALKKRALGLEPEGPAGNWDPRLAASLVDKALRQYHKLNIRTIDSLVVVLARAFALDMGVSPDFSPCMDQEEIFAPVFDLFAEGMRDNPAHERLFTEAVSALMVGEGASGFWLSSKVRARVRETVDFMRDNPGPCVSDRELIGSRLAASHERLMDRLEDLRQGLAQAEVELLANADKFLDSFEGTGPFSQLRSSAYGDKESARDLVKKASRTKVDDQLDKRYLAFAAAYDEHVYAHAVLSPAYSLAPVLGLADILAPLMAARERERSELLLSRLAPRVLELLEQGRLPEAFCRLGAKLRHLLIDEFQDTNRDQWRTMHPLAAECLSKAGGLFYVGDVKQAIYGWRGGDADLFDEVLADPELTAMARPVRDTLPNNWRSAPRVVEFNNTFFEKLSNADICEDLIRRTVRDCPTQVAVDFSRSLAAAYTGASQVAAHEGKDPEGFVRMVRLGEDETEERAFIDLFEELGGRRG